MRLAGGNALNVLHINSYYGKRMFYRELYEQQRALGLSLCVYIPVAKNYNDQGKHFGEYAILSKNHGKYDRIFFMLKHRKILADLENTIDVKQFSIIHAHSLFSNGWLAMKQFDQHKIPYVVAVRSTDVDFFFRRMPHLRHIGREILEKASRVIFLSPSHQQKLLRHYVSEALSKKIREKSLIIPNGIDDFWFQQQGEARHVSDNRPLRLLQVGDIRDRKNILMTLKAVDLLQEEGMSVQLDVVGRIRDEKMGQTVKRHPAARYLGYLPKEALLPIYRENDIFVLPSKQETFGLVYAEAMSQGLPIIYTKNQGFDGQFEEGLVGYHVDSQSAEDIVSKILKIKNEYQEISARTFACVERFSWNKIAQSCLELYKEVGQGIR